MHRRIRLSAAIVVQNIMTRLHLVADALLLQLIPNNIFFAQCAISQQETSVSSLKTPIISFVLNTDSGDWPLH